MYLLLNDIIIKKFSDKEKKANFDKSFLSFKKKYKGTYVYFTSFDKTITYLCATIFLGH